MLIDSHCHLHDIEFFDEDFARGALKRAHENGVEKIVCIGTSHEDSLAARDFAEQHEGAYWTYGVHPSEAKAANNLISSSNSFARACLHRASSLRTASEPSGARSQKKLNYLPLIAIGEVGLDYHYDGYDREAQIKLFEQMLQLAVDLELPLSFHVREAFDDFFGVVDNFPSVRGVVHSFSDNKRNLRRVLERNFYVGVNGMATYSTLPTPPLERILLETDAPFLAPVPYRGQTCEPGMVKNVAEWLAGKLGVNEEEVARMTTRNVEDLFNLT